MAYLFKTPGIRTFFCNPSLIQNGKLQLFFIEQPECFTGLNRVIDISGIGSLELVFLEYITYRNVVGIDSFHRHEEVIATSKLAFYFEQQLSPKTIRLKSHTTYKYHPVSDAGTLIKSTIENSCNDNQEAQCICNTRSEKNLSNDIAY